MGRYVRHTKEELEKAVKDSQCVSDVVRKIGLRMSGGSHAHIKGRLKYFGIDTHHFLGKSVTCGRVFHKKKTPAEYLVLYDHHINTDPIKKRMLRDGVKVHKCEICGNAIWMGKPIPLELHHLNGNRSDNRLENLQILCSNCHAQTENYCGKGTAAAKANCALCKARVPRVKKSLYSLGRICKHCGKDIQDRSKHDACQKCVRLELRKAIRPTKQELLEYIKENSYEAAGRKYGVTGNAIRKWLK